MKLRLGTRGSALAVAQSTLMARALEAAHPGLAVELVTLTTTGDKLQQGGTKPEGLTKAVFTKEIEEALLAREVDLAVHSSKDLAAQMPEGLEVAAFPERAPPADVLITKAPAADVRSRAEALLATGSERRRLQWKEHHPATRFAALRGNIDTRIRRLRETAEWDGILLAQAGLERLRPDVAGLHVTPLGHDWMLPAPGQGALALQVRAGDAAAALVAALDHGPTRRAVEAERAFLAAMEAGCEVPLGALAQVDGEVIRLRAVYYAGVGRVRREGEATGSDPVEVGRALAGEIGR